MGEKKLLTLVVELSDDGRGADERAEEVRAAVERSTNPIPRIVHASLSSPEGV